MAIVAAGALTLFSLHESRNAVAPGNRPIQSDIPKYVTSATCRSCHPGNYASWHTSFHRTMTQVATPQSLPNDMHDLELSLAGKDYRVERKGDQFFVRKRTHDSGNEFGSPQQVVLVTGSHTLQIPWLETGAGRTLEQFPFAYIIAEKMWAPVAETFLIPPTVKEYYSIGVWNGACMDCHVTQGHSRFVKGNEWDSRVAEFGIACEACHSQGQEHVARNRNPVRRFLTHLTTKKDATITNPSRLKGPEATLACGQCHSIWAFKDMENKIDFNRHGGAFRPGGKELVQRFVVQPNEPDHASQKDFIRKTEPDFFQNRFWGDGMIRVTGREMNGTQQSPCFKGGDFSCLSCHEMHPAQTTRVSLTKWARHAQLKPHMDSDQACLQCHKTFATKIPAHTHHAADSPGSRCYNCHMPNTTFGLLHAMRSHQVSSPTVRESVAFGRPNACNLCHLNQTLAWTGQKLHDWYQKEAPQLSTEDQTIAAGVQWIVKGDAGQRALIAWGMGWAPAQKASGTDWMYPYLIYAFVDPYAAVRFDAWKSLQTLPQFTDFSFTYTADAVALDNAAADAYEKWYGTVRDPKAFYRAETGLNSEGRFNQAIFQPLRQQRDDKPIILAE